jgi:hypothetical protein
MTWRKVGRSLSSVVLFGVAASFLLQSWWLGWLLTFSLVLHEVGHIIQLQRYHVDWEVRFGLFGAATITPLDQRRALDCYQNAVIHLAGPLTNLAQALVAFGLPLVLNLLTVEPASCRWLQVGNFAALLTLVNLLPLARLSDGGKLAEVIFASLTERSDTTLLATLFLWLASIVWLAGVSWGSTLRTLSTLAIAVWFVLGMLLAHRRDDPAAAFDPDAMSRAQSFVLFGVMAAGLLISTALVVLTPFWLTPDQVEVMARNLTLTFALLRRYWLEALVLLAGAVTLYAVLSLIFGRHDETTA